jgi:hypothetical protein
MITLLPNAVPLKKAGLDAELATGVLSDQRGQAHLPYPEIIKLDLIFTG